MEAWKPTRTVSADLLYGFVVRGGSHASTPPSPLHVLMGMAGQAVAAGPSVRLLVTGRDMADTGCGTFRRGRRC